VKVAKSLEQVREYADAIMGMQLVTHQTGPEGQKVRRLLIEEGADIAKELYVSMVTDRISQRVVLMASSEGGMDIEEVAEKHPELITLSRSIQVLVCKTLKLMISPAKSGCQKVLSLMRVFNCKVCLKPSWKQIVL
jgi:succinyl-CoA synthetase beta subunit